MNGRRGKPVSIDLPRFERLLDTFSEEGRVYIPVPAGDDPGVSGFRYRERAAGVPFVLPGVRTRQPLKPFLFSPRMKVSEYPGPREIVPGVTDTPVFLVGAAACDVVALRSLDVIYLQEEFTDVFYRSRRESTVVIGMDCTEPLDTCFCTLAGHGPWPREGFDLSLSPGDGCLLVESGSDRGDAIMARHTALFSEPTEEQLRERDRRRSETTERIASRNREYTLDRSRRDILETMRASDAWFTHVETCVGCGACLFACPTCHCFLLYDQRGGGGGYERIKEWDVCIYAGFSRMAGGSSPRLGIMERFRHRYQHKLEYYPKNFGFEACTGCGRCIAGCMGRIDMRVVLKDLDTREAGVNRQ